MTAAEEPATHAARRGSGEGTSPEPLRYLAVGRILRPWGLSGWVKTEVLTDFPERFDPPGTLLVGEERRPVRLEASRKMGRMILLKFAGYETPEACAGLREQTLYIPIEDAKPLPEGELYVYQLIGLEVWTDEGERLGRVTDLWETGSNDVYVVDREGQVILLPAIKEVVRAIDIERGRMTVHLMEGLLP